VIALPEVFIGLSNPEIQIFESVGSSTLTVRIQAHQEVASMFGRQPRRSAAFPAPGSSLRDLQAWTRPEGQGPAHRSR
jgi:hypothetical protein